ncbi:hypothetical protein SNE40_007535 [Patella caerulea]|uniref:Uncharacterized protein n=1 Tax=Patella caerulea TaxID=87958 RepID=A0AAN8Q8E3_PATCE
MNHNKIKNLSVFIATLSKNCPRLRYLSLMNNEAAPSYFNGGTLQQYNEFRYFVISSLPRLEHLDFQPVTPEERIEAEKAYGLYVVRRRKKKENPSSVDE